MYTNFLYLELRSSSIFKTSLKSHLLLAFRCAKHHAHRAHFAEFRSPVHFADLFQNKKVEKEKELDPRVGCAAILPNSAEMTEPC